MIDTSAGGVSGRVRLIASWLSRACAVLAPRHIVSFGVKAMNMSFKIVSGP
ncbi:hypothetical protein [Rhizobium wuzhouense]|uniref:hypothetical protein n=1 Tax=Rhizobium wuzhouense TaxID=1986026 RepID=UPI00140201B0|nr:hypothetical protein [Rhizobium wuzhouense]